MASWEASCPAEAIQARSREDELWLLTCGVLVIQMQAAFALIEAGCVRSMNVVNIMMKNMIDLTLGGVVWYLFGYWATFNPGGAYSLEVADTSHWFFTWSFAATCSTIISGVVAERISFIPYIFISLIQTMLIYPISAHVVWHPDGFLQNLGFLDFAGGAAVHVLGASSSIVCCCMLGPRIGRFTDYVPTRGKLAAALMRRSQDPEYYMLPVGTPKLVPVTDSVSLIFGVFFLWVGWYGFNPGSTLGTEGAKTYVASKVTLNTTLGALGGALFESSKAVAVHRGRFTPEGLSVGVLAGLVAITAGCPWLYSRDAFILGFLGAAVATLAKLALEAALVDDVVSAIPVHGGGGLMGTIGVAFFARDWPCNNEAGFPVPAGIFYAPPENQGRAWEFLAHQLCGCTFIVAFGCCATFVLIVLMNQCPVLRLRVHRDVELYGMDECEHGTSHDEVDFETMMKDTVHMIAMGKGSPEEVYEAFRSANRCFSMSHEMERIKSKRYKVMEGARLDITVKHFLGYNSRPPGRSKYQVKVELILAVPTGDGEGLGETMHQFYPQRTTRPISASRGSMCWDETFTYQALHLPVGCRRNAFARFSVLRAGRVVGRAHALLVPFGWPDESVQYLAGAGIACDMRLDLVSSNAGSSAGTGPCALKVRLCYPDGTRKLSDATNGCLSYARMAKEVEPDPEELRARKVDKLRDESADLRDKLEGLQERLAAVEKELTAMVMDTQRSV